jgi:D-3-phosphoglycerate dehydrogenase
MPKVFISDNLSPRGLEVFAERGVEAEMRPGLDADALAAALAGVDGLVVRSSTQVSAEMLAGAPDLKAVGRAGVGIDNIDLTAATARGVVVMNTPYGNSVTTAEHAIAMLLALARQIPQADRSTQAGEWAKSRFMGVELFQKVMGIVGCGNIGSNVARLAQGLRMRVIAYDPYLSPEHARGLGVEKVEFDVLLARADVVSLHTPLTDLTRHLIDADAIARMKPDARLINCARGGLVDEAALDAALKSGHLAGAAFDVFETEPATDNSLFGADNFIATPHLGAATAEAQENVAVQIAEQMADFLLTGAISNALNMASVSAEEAPQLKPYLQLAEQLGSFGGQLTEHGLRAVRIEYEGHVAELNTKPLTAICLEGLLRPLMESVNMVNAPVVARERNIDVSEICHDRPSDYQALIKLTVITERQERSVAGTLFAGSRPRLVEVKGIPIEAELAAHMLYVANEDKPGLIGSLGKILGDAGVNIATFHLGRAAPGGDAIALIQVDDPVPDAVLKSIRALPYIIQAKALHF